MEYTTADRLSYLKETKTGIREAINAKGGSLTETVPFRDYIDAINALSGGSSGGGSLNMANITRATDTTFDISNYVAEGDNFILLYTYGESTYARGMLVSEKMPSGSTAYTTSNNTASSTGILTIGGNATGATSATGFLIELSAPVITYSEGIITISSATYKFGTNAILFYAG